VPKLVVATAIPEVTEISAPIGRGLRWPEGVESDHLFGSYRLRQVLIPGAAAVKPTCTGIVWC
jgi:hypothetical protein